MQKVTSCLHPPFLPQQKSDAMSKANNLMTDQLTATIAIFMESADLQKRKYWLVIYLLCGCFCFLYSSNDVIITMKEKVLTSMTLMVVVRTAVSVAWSTILVQTEISRQLLDGFSLTLIHCPLRLKPEMYSSFVPFLSYATMFFCWIL